MNRTAYFERENVYVFGHSLRNANLVDIIFASDDYKVEIETPVNK